MSELTLKKRKITANDVRIPPPVRGTAMVVTRYDKDQSVILHPDDFGELLLLDDLVDRSTRLKPFRYSEAGRRAHLEEDRSSGEPIEDPEVLRRLFG
jgi:hypothetical protein